MIAAIVAGLVGILIGVVNLRAYLRARAQAKSWEGRFQPLEGSIIPGLLYTGGDPATLRVACALAVQALEDHVVGWQPTPLARPVHTALAGVKVIVKDTLSWKDPYGREVAGLALDDGSVAVGSNLAALAHEFAHRCEAVLDRTEDADHRFWEARGISTALRAYQKETGTT